MGGFGLIFTSALARHLVGPLGLSGPITSTSWLHSSGVATPEPTRVQALVNLTCVLVNL